MNWREKLGQIKKGITKKKFDPWNEPTPKPKVTDEELKKAVEHMNDPKPPSQLPLRAIQGFMILWSIGHFALLYVMIGAPIAGGILAYVLINLAIFSHYFILLKKDR